MGVQGPEGLQGHSPTLHVETIAGGEAGTALAVAGIAEGDTVANVTVLDVAGGTATDVTGEASIPADGSVQLSDTDTTGKNLLVFWVGSVSAGH